MLDKKKNNTYITYRSQKKRKKEKEGERRDGMKVGRQERRKKERNLRGRNKERAQSQSGEWEKPIVVAKPDICQV